MKRSIIVAISLVIGISFAGLLILQTRIIASMITMRKEQFDESVFRALDRTSRNLERNETFNYLRSIATASDYEVDSLRALSSPLEKDLTGIASMKEKSYDNPFAIPAQERRSTTMSPLSLSPSTSLDETSQRLQSFMRDAYLYEKNLLEEVIYTMLYNASEEDFRHRIDFEALATTLRDELAAAGVTIPFHFVVLDSRGSEVYRSAEYDATGEEYSFSQILFRNDPSQKMGLLRLHFPDRRDYVMGVVARMLPMIIFTLVLFFTFCFTVWLIVRQKRETEMKNDFINNMTHEFKTPLTTISLAAQMLQDGSISIEEHVRQHCTAVIQSESKRLRYQIDKVLQMSLFEHGNIRFNEVEVDANRVIDDVAATFQIKMSSCHGRVVTSLEAAESEIYVDEMHFTNVIYNLLDNAIKYRREDVDLLLNITTRNKGDHLIITISDNGIGIRSDDLRHVFERFYRVHTGKQHDVKGFGIGLAYVKNMVGLMHGTIRAESQLGQGTRFTITLPVNREG